jgi:hypothetical protein
VERPSNASKLGYKLTTLPHERKRKQRINRIKGSLLRNWHAHKAVAEPRQLYPHVYKLKGVLGPIGRSKILRDVSRPLPLVAPLRHGANPDDVRFQGKTGVRRETGKE